MQVTNVRYLYKRGWEEEFNACSRPICLETSLPRIIKSTLFDSNICVARGPTSPSHHVIFGMGGGGWWEAVQGIALPR